VLRAPVKPSEPTLRASGSLQRSKPRCARKSLPRIGMSPEPGGVISRPVQSLSSSRRPSPDRSADPPGTGRFPAARAEPHPSPQTCFRRPQRRRRPSRLLLQPLPGPGATRANLRRGPPLPAATPPRSSRKRRSSRSSQGRWTMGTTEDNHGQRRGPSGFRAKPSGGPWGRETMNIPAKGPRRLSPSSPPRPG